MSASDSVDTSVASQGRDHLNAHFFVVLPDNPGFTGKVEFAEDVNTVFADILG